MYPSRERIATTQNARSLHRNFKGHYQILYCTVLYCSVLQCIVRTVLLFAEIANILLDTNGIDLVSPFTAGAAPFPFLVQVLHVSLVAVGRL